ncbi:MAG: Hsp33 family molecular chaperone HslO [Alphaproteobacteria bacterium]|uniref:Hsp33 family molecular chaperone HslO n=1 Tax=Pacificispira sp. TaxID=2888761 RepID=UPI001B1CD08D|nr:Hsp33 family molecular chaperone HslO [Alphaproteobacteria bacterium]MBO6864376.1 Hsp33 family molecular chaperone HslO [Alphaproteobacteria bacterium]MEC9267063.1 Hsp33 family molecular chaperone HslO [Pseudomonadota bacterium]
MADEIRIPVPGDAASNPVTDDVVQPFMIDATGLHGRMVKLGPSVDAILKRHGYPDAVQHLLAEMLALGAGLSAALKFDGIFTLQTKGDGPVPMLVADVTSDGVLRGYAQVKGTVPPLHEVVQAPVPKLLGKGYLAFTVDQGQHMERYQGIVELEGATVEECVHRYFAQSDQFASAVKLAAGRRPDGTMGAAALLVQRLPDEGGDQSIGHADEDDWRRACMLMETATGEEMLDPSLPPNDLLYRLFHEDGVRVFEPRPIVEKCRCSRDRIETVLASMERESLDDLKLEDGTLEVVCEFCSRKETFTDAQLDQARAQKSP